MQVCIVGAGITGTTMAIYLARAGFAVNIYEKRSEALNNAGTRSIAMSLSRRGLNALHAIGAHSILKDSLTPTYGRASHSRDNEVYYQNYSLTNHKDAIYTINRQTLNNVLVSLARDLGVNIYFESTLSDLDVEHKQIIVSQGIQRNIYQYDHLIAADGVFSPVRESLRSQGIVPPALKQLGLSYKEFSIPYHSLQRMQLNKDYVHVWAANKSIFVALPCTQEQMFIANLYTSINFNSKTAEADFIRSQLCSIYEIIPDIESQIYHNPFNKMFTVDCQTWNYQNSVLLIGDACHAIAPFYAMGMNLCLEDCHVFNTLLTNHNFELGAVIEAFQAERKPDTDAMAKLALENFYTLKHSTNADHRLRNELEVASLQYIKPERRTTYEEVAFSSIQLHDVYNLHLQKNKIIDSIIQKCRTKSY